jgi:phage host-nuclease inhibitor protein Gam
VDCITAEAHHPVDARGVCMAAEIFERTHEILMNKINRTKTRAAVSREEMELAVGIMRQIDIKTQRLLARKNREVAEIDERYAPLLAEAEAAKKEKHQLVQAWAEAHPEAFGKTKSIALAAGTIGFRTGTPKLALLNRKFTWASALEAVMRLLPNFIRTSPEIDKEALIAQRDETTIQWALTECGLKIVQDESFYVKTNVEEAETMTKEAA